MSNKFYRKKVNYDQDQVTFQATEWVDLNENFEIETDDEPIIDQRYVLKIFGVTEQGVSVCCNVKEFTPFFYVKIPSNWGKTNVSKFIDNLFLTKTYRYSRPYPDLLKYRKNILEDRCIIQIKKDFYGFNNQTDFKFLRLTFNNSDVMRRVLYKIRHHNDPDNESVIKEAPKELKIYEANLDPILRFIHIKNLQPAGWITAKKIIHPTVFTSKCQIEFDVIYTDIESFEKIGNAPILQASFDIETYSHDDAFPSPKHPDNHVFQIATTFKRYTEDDTFFKHIICLKKCAPLENTDIHLECYETEKEVLLAWVNLIQKMDPDIIYSYNGDQFDCNYLVERAKLLGIETQFYNISRLKDIQNPPCKLVVKSFSSSAYGDSEYNRLLIPGRINFDILIYIRREYKETSYKLDYIAEKYVGENKNPVTPQMMFDAFRNQDVNGIKDCALYCVQDTLLPQKISDALYILQNQISMSNVTYVPIKYLIERGQQIKAFSQILRETRKLGYLVPTLYNVSNVETDDQTKFQGATVLPPITGAYFEPVTVCDFASLYPSIIRAHNLCYSTIVTDPKYSNLPGVEYETFTWEDKDEKTNTIVKHSFDYVTNIPGILPGILKQLAESRNYYKKLMKGAKNTFEKEIYNKCQLAVKVSMNSVYGFLAAQMLTCKPIAATVTYVGRTMIANTKKFMEDNYKASVAVYGDSVTHDTPIITRENVTGFIDIRPISDFCFEDEWKPYEEFKHYSTNRTDKQQYKPPSYSVWSDNGWVPLHRIIRHRCDKDIFRVTTNSGSVDVTEDHSLLTANIVKVKPKELVIGNTLLHINNFPTIDFMYSNTIFANTEHVKLLGFLFKNANISNRTVSNGVTLNVLTVTHRTRECLKMILELIYKYEKAPRQDIQIYRIEETSDYMFEILNNPNDSYTIVEKINECFYSTRTVKRIPGLLINSPENIRKSFIEGVLMFNNFTFAYDTEEKVFTQGLLVLAESVGITLKTNDIGVYMSFDDKEQTCRTELLSSSSIINIKNLGKTREYVYDIETGIGRFHASVGKIVVANTDSVFIKFKTETTEKYTREKDRIYSQVVITDADKQYINELKTKCIRESITLGKEAAQKATKALFKEPINLEYEKVYTPLLMLSKKRYIGQLYSENPEKYDKIDNKGVILTRRDNFNLLKIAYKTIVDIYMEKGAIGNNEVIKYIENIMDSIKNKNVNLDDLIITKSLRKDYKSQNIPHLVLSRKIAERDPNNAPRANDRIPYLFIDTNVAKIMPQYTKVEDPEYVRANNLALDAEYYIKFISNPLCEIMELFIDNPEKIFKDYIKKFKDARKLRLKPPKPAVVKKITKPRISKKKI